MDIALIAAVAANGVVGRNNDLPWRLPGDLAYFKRTTLGKPVVMGRLTWESIGRPLPGRSNIVVSRQPNLVLEGAQVCADLESALELAAAIASEAGCEELMVIGGARIYAQALPLAQRFYLTEVHAEVEGDAYFPDWDRARWRETHREHHAAAGDNPYDYSFVTLERC